MIRIEVLYELQQYDPGVAPQQQRMTIILTLLHRVEEAQLPKPIVAFVTDCADRVLQHDQVRRELLRALLQRHILDSQQLGSLLERAPQPQLAHRAPK